MEIRELRYFVAVAEDLSFTRAALRLQMSQPPLSQAIARLEKKLGSRLFEREPRKAPRLTPAGAVLLREARRILKQIDEAQSLLDSVVADVEVLRIGSISSVLAGLLPSVVREFRSQHREVRILVEESEERRILTDLRSGAVDLGFTRARRTDQGFVSEFLADEPLVCAMPDTHRLAGERSVALAELATEDFVMFHRDDAPQAYDRIVLACVRAGFSPRIPLHAVNDLAMLSTISCGLGVAVMPHVSSFLPIPGVRFVPLRDEWAVTSLSMTWMASTANPVTRAFTLAVRAELERRRSLDLAEGRRTFQL